MHRSIEETMQVKEGTNQPDAKRQAGILRMIKPWILPDVVARSLLISFIAVGIFWLEFSIGLAYATVFSVQLFLWSGLAILLIWLLSLAPLLLLRAANTYILRNDGLEIRIGIVTSKAFVISPSGFSDLEVARSVSGRIMNSGDIVIRTQGERDAKMGKVRNPMKVADQIRGVMARPTVRIERQEVVAK